MAIIGALVVDTTISFAVTLRSPIWSPRTTPWTTYVYNSVSVITRME